MTYSTFQMEDLFLTVLVGGVLRWLLVLNLVNTSYIVDYHEKYRKLMSQTEMNKSGNSLLPDTFPSWHGHLELVHAFLYSF